MRPGIATLVRTVQPGDEILVDDAFVRVASIRRAQGRKPKVGENMRLVTDAGVVMKLNSADPIRVRRPG
jgi:hypothetical protein